MSYPGTEVSGKVSIQERRAKVRIGWGDLRNLIITHAVEAAGLGDAKGSIRIEQETEGSPPYGVARWNAFVDLVEDISTNGATR